jgi:hypothetical protein
MCNETSEPAIRRATVVLMARFDVSQIVALGLLLTIADRSTTPVDVLARRVVATSNRSRLVSR